MLRSGWIISVEASGGQELENLLKNLEEVSPLKSSVPNMLFSPAPIKGFKGRAKELKRLIMFLNNKTISIILIDGISGIGKTALAIHLADTLKQENTSFWIDCREDTSFDSITYGLAIFAKNNGNESLSNILEDVTVP
jgi:Cdc6-like AAA superfamily ATPase